MNHNFTFDEVAIFIPNKVSNKIIRSVAHKLVDNPDFRNEVAKILIDYKRQELDNADIPEIKFVFDNKQKVWKFNKSWEKDNRVRYIWNPNYAYMFLLDFSIIERDLNGTETNVDFYTKLFEKYNQNSILNRELKIINHTKQIQEYLDKLPSKYHSINKLLERAYFDGNLDLVKQIISEFDKQNLVQPQIDGVVTGKIEQAIKEIKTYAAEQTKKDKEVKNQGKEVKNWGNLYSKLKLGRNLYKKYVEYEKFFWELSESFFWHEKSNEFDNPEYIKEWKKHIVTNLSKRYFQQYKIDMKQILEHNWGIENKVENPKLREYISDFYNDKLPPEQVLINEKQQKKQQEQQVQELSR